jgi:hypothetical protein
MCLASEKATSFFFGAVAWKSERTNRSAFARGGYSASERDASLMRGAEKLHRGRNPAKSDASMHWLRRLQVRSMA